MFFCPVIWTPHTHTPAAQHISSWEQLVVNTFNWYVPSTLPTNEEVEWNFIRYSWDEWNAAVYSALATVSITYYRYDVFVHWHCHYSILAHVRHGHGGCCCWSNATQINLTFSISVSASAQHMLPAVTLFRVHVKEMRNCFRTNGIRHIQYATIRRVCV